MNQLQPLRVLFSCAGLGMGNASRVAAVVEELQAIAAEHGHEVNCQILTWGSGHSFLQKYLQLGKSDFQLFELNSYAKASRGIEYLFTYWKNVILVRRAMKIGAPDLVVLDSDYHFPSFFFSGRQIVYIGQATDVIERAKDTGYVPASIFERWNFVFKERLDAFVQRLFSSLVLVPSFLPSTSSAAKIRKIPLIVRREFIARPLVVAAKGSLGIFLSGSGIEQGPLLSFAKKNQLRPIGPGDNSEHTAVPSRVETIDAFETVIIQGGLSSISECLARNKYLVVFPMKNHPEQRLNGLTVERIGRGIWASQKDLESLAGLRMRIAAEKTLPNNAAVIALDGAAVAAKIILEMATTARAENKARH
jgi:hypothetical protein